LRLPVVIFEAEPNSALGTARQFLLRELPTIEPQLAAACPSGIALILNGG